MQGHPTIRTPNIDALARGGVRFTQWLSANSVCTPSRAALLTGRLPVRSGMTGTYMLRMYSAQQGSGLPAAEITLPEALRAVHPNMTHALVGKWHLGINAVNNTGAYLPLQHGFDRFYGLPMGNKAACEVNATYGGDPLKCFLYRDNTIIEQPTIPGTLSDRLTNEAVAIIEANAGVRPFFLYYAFPQTHVPTFSAPRNAGRSRRGAYGDAIEDVDDAVGRVMDALRAAGQADNTLVVFTSDNGAWIEQKTDSGSNGLLLGGKSQDVEGGLRVPGIVWGPGLGVRADYVSHALASTMDVFATVLDYAGVPLPADRAIDGRSLRGVLDGTEADAVTADARVLFHYCGYELHAMRYGPWKAHFATPLLSDPIAHTCTYVFFPEAFPTTIGCGCADFLSERHDPPLLYNLDVDPGERYLRDPATDPAAAAALAVILAERDKHLAELVPGPSQVDTGTDPSLQPCCAPPLCRCTEEQEQEQGNHAHDNHAHDNHAHDNHAMGGLQDNYAMGGS